MKSTPTFTEPTAKFNRYRQELLDKQQSADRAAAKRAGFELSLMEGSHFLELNGIVHHCHLSGPEDAAVSVVLIHGWDCWWMWWHHIIRALNEQGIRTIAYDMRAHGWSDNDPEHRYHIGSFAHDLEALVEQLGLERFHVAAFSFGPFVALDYARTHPERLLSATFFNFGYLPHNDFIEQFANNTLNFVFNILLRKLTWWLPAYVFARLVLARNTVALHDILIGFKSLGLCASEAIEQTTMQITSKKVTSELPGMVRAFKAPLLFVAGAGDTIMTCENAERLVQEASNGGYVCVPECGHLITLELPETASELILGQVASVEPSLRARRS